MFCDTLDDDNNDDDDDADNENDVDVEVDDDDDDNEINATTDYTSELCKGVFADLTTHKNDNNYLFSALFKYFYMRLVHDENLCIWIRKLL